MKYGDITYDFLLDRMIKRVDDWARKRGVTVDTREGSIIRTALSPAAAELALMYIEIDEILDETFADTASRKYLIRRCAERGVKIDAATKAVRQGEFNVDISIGSRFTLNRLRYAAKEKISAGVYKMECETPGNAGNLDSGDLLPVDYIDGLELARLTDVIIPGEDDELTEHIRRKYFDSLDSQAFGGNVADYKVKVNQLPGVGGCKIYPVWNGGGTVKVVFVNSMFGKPSNTLVGDVQTAIDPVLNQGAGIGFAPIGHTVTVKPVDELSINIKINAAYHPGWDWTSVKPYVEAAVDQYFHELSEQWDKTDWENDPGASLVVRISHIETRLLNIAGIIDLHDTKINGQTQNVILEPDCIPVRGLVSSV